MSFEDSLGGAGCSEVLIGVVDLQVLSRPCSSGVGGLRCCQGRGLGFRVWGSTFQGPLKEEHSCKKACSSVKLKWDLALYETTTYNLSPTTPDA